MQGWGCYMALGGVRRLSLTQPSPAGRGLGGACAIIRLGGSIRCCLPYSVGAHGRAPLPRTTKPGHHHETTSTANEKPSPSGRGLGEGESLCASQRHITPPNPIVIPALIVIPAKAGIHTPPYDTPGATGVLDSGLRRNDGEGGGGGSCLLGGSIGIGVGIESPQPPFCERGAFNGLRPTPSFPRKRESTPRPSRHAEDNRGSGFRPAPE